ncbi:hypothetical protein KIPE111705_39605 [Kibdelosporangium persicum]
MFGELAFSTMILLSASVSTRYPQIVIDGLRNTPGAGDDLGGEDPPDCALVLCVLRAQSVCEVGEIRIIAS